MFRELSRGVALPLLLDDVLVNFDDDRVAAAAKLLHEYGERGRQVLLFTGHRHIAAAFQSQGIEVRKLPWHEEIAQGGGKAAVAQFDETTVDLPEPQPQPEPIPEPVVELPSPPKPRVRAPMVVIRVEAAPANGNSRLPPAYSESAVALEAAP